LPGYVVVEDAQDALQTQPIRHRPRTRRLLWPGRQQRFDPPISRRPRSTAEYSRHPERPKRHIGHARPGHLNKILLRALKVDRPGFRSAAAQLRSNRPLLAH
jgi:hypothetical protein